MNNKSIKYFAVITLILLMSVAMSACGQMDFIYKQNDDGTYCHIFNISLSGNTYDTGFTVEKALSALYNGFVKNGYAVTVDENGNSLSAYKKFNNLDELHSDRVGNGLYVEDINNDEGFMNYREIKGIPVVSQEFYSDSRFIISVKVVLIDGGLTAIEADKVLAAMETMKTSYSFITPYKSTTSNADSIYKDGDYYTHKWDLNEDTEIRLTLKSLNGSLWYAVAIISSAVITLIIAVVKVIKANSSKGIRKED